MFSLNHAASVALKLVLRLANYNESFRQHFKQQFCLKVNETNELQQLFYFNLFHFQDGIKIPITLVHKNDLALDGNNPLLLYVCGAYGQSLEMSYSPEMIPLLERGWVFAYCHAR